MVFVDPLQDFGWILRGHRVKSCHLFTDQVELEELHSIAAKIGMQRRWFQSASKVAPHYDLTSSRRLMALAAGARELTRRESVDVWKRRRELVHEESSARIQCIHDAKL